MDEDGRSPTGSKVMAALDALAEVRRYVLSDTLTFSRRQKQLATMHARCDTIIANCEAIMAALDGSEGEAQTERPA